MTTQIARRRGARGLYKKPDAVQQSTGPKRRKLPEYLEKAEIDALMQAAHDPAARLLILVQWRAGLRISEALALEPRDLKIDSDRPQVFIRAGKGNKDRMVPMHGELRAALSTALAFGNVGAGPICGATRSTAWRWLKAAQKRAEAAGAITEGKHIGTHTLRHSFARHCLASGIPLNRLSLWLGHEDISTTLIYLQILPDPLGEIDRVP